MNHECATCRAFNENKSPTTASICGTRSFWLHLILVPCRVYASVSVFVRNYAYSTLDYGVFNLDKVSLD